MDEVAVLRAARSLVEVPDGEVLPALAEVLEGALPAEDLLWVDSDFTADRFYVWRAGQGSRDNAAESVMSRLLDHPAIQSYVRDPSNLLPRRLVDLPPALLQQSHESLQLSQRELGRYQLSLIVDVQAVGRGSGWIALGDVKDFTDEALASARQLLPIVLLMSRLRLRPVPHSRNGTPLDCDSAAASWPSLSAREQQVADLLTTGLTAVSIGRLLGISPRTVSKHVEHIYAKLGEHDRLLVATGALRS